jgi:hypothetical protein
LQPPQGREGGPANFSRQLRIYFRDRFCIAANTSGYVSLARDRIDRVVVFVAISESEAIAGEQKIDDLAPAVGPGHASACRSRDDPEPAVGRFSLATDLLARRAARDRGERGESFELPRTAGRRLMNLWAHGILQTAMADPSGAPLPSKPPATAHHRPNSLRWRLRNYP